MALLSDFVGGKVPDYLEYTWMVAPSSSGQSLVKDVITTLTLTNEVIDTNNNGTISSNQITLNAGTYYCEAYVPLYVSYGAVVTLLLTDVTSTPVYKASKVNTCGGAAFVDRADLSTQFVVPVNGTKYELRALVNGHDNASVSNTYYRSYVGDVNYTVGLPLIQRTTVKLWKIK